MSLSDGLKRVWIVGSSLIRDAFVRARNSDWGTGLDLQRHGVHLWWQFRGGMKWDDLCHKIIYLLKFEDAPDYLVIHCGGNDFGSTSAYELREQMRASISYLSRCLPNTRLVWSQILPRLVWRHERSHSALERVRIRTNNFLANLVIRSGGAYIRYPELTERNPGMFSTDNVHLSMIGNDLFLYRIQQAIHVFVTTESVVSPPTGESGPWLY